MIIDEPGVFPKSEIYIFDPSPVAMQSLIYIPFWGDYFCQVPYKIEREYYDWLMIISIHSGQLELNYEGQVKVLPAGCIQILDCRVPQSYRALGEIHFDWFHFKGGSSQALFSHLAEHQTTCFAAAEHPKLASEMARLKQQISTVSDDDFLINLALTRLLTQMIETISGPGDFDHSLITEAHAYMSEHFREDIQLQDIARRFNISTCHFARQFRRQFKVSPHEYLISLRISDAKRQLLLSGKSVEAIATSCGFNSTSHFVRSFGQRTGLTPAQYRKQKF